MSDPLYSALITLKVNGQAHETAARTVLGLLESLDIPLGKVAVERNREIVPKSTFPEALLADGDEIEIVNFVGGG